MSNQFPTLHIVDHPLVQHKLSVMRDKNTSVKDFRALVGEIAMLLTYEATRDLPMTTRTIETPICSYEAPVLAGKKLAIVPILRAGLGFEDGILTLVPSARVAHIGMYRDEETLEPHFYFLKYPKDIAGRDVLIVDPMLATGGSATLEETGINALLQSGDYDFYFRGRTDDAGQPVDVYRAAFSCDWYLASANAITEDGQILNIDGRGNRLAAMVYGIGKTVYIVAGTNKICPDFDSALSRARNTAAVQNMRRFDGDQPCHTAGRCLDCRSKSRGCNALLVLWGQMMDMAKVEVVLIDEPLGL